MGDDIKSVSERATKARGLGASDPKSAGGARRLRDPGVADRLEPQVHVLRGAARSLKQGGAHAHEEVSHTRCVQRLQEPALGLSKKVEVCVVHARVRVEAARSRFAPVASACGERHLSSSPSSAASCRARCRSASSSAKDARSSGVSCASSSFRDKGAGVETIVERIAPGDTDAWRAKSDVV